MTEQTYILPKGERDIARLVGALSALPREKAFKVVISENRKRRTNDQNAWLWGVAYKIICSHLEGWSAHDVHAWCLGEWGGFEQVEMFGKTHCLPIRRSSKLTTKEFMQYKEWIQNNMAERGIDIPDPNQEDELKSYEQYGYK